MEISCPCWAPVWPPSGPRLRPPPLPSPQDFTAQESKWAGPGPTCAERVAAWPLRPLLHNHGTQAFLACASDSHPHLRCPSLLSPEPRPAACRSQLKVARALPYSPLGLFLRPVCSQGSAALTVHPSPRAASVPPAGRVRQGQGQDRGPRGHRVTCAPVTGLSGHGEQAHARQQRVAAAA